MRRYYQVAGLAALAMSIWVMVESRTGLNYYTEYGPGPGFFPFWCGALLAGLSFAWLLQVTLRPVEAKLPGFIPDREGAIRVGSAVLALLIFGSLMGLLGFHLALLIFLWFLLLSLGRQKHLAAALLAAAGSTVLTVLFRVLLDVPLPRSAFELLRELGL